MSFPFLPFVVYRRLLWGVGILYHHEWSTLGLAGWLHIVVRKERRNAKPRGDVRRRHIINEMSECITDGPLCGCDCFFWSKNGVSREFF